MSEKKRYQFCQRRVADPISEELTKILMDGAEHEFRPLFSGVFQALKARKAVGGGEEMIRLRCYEKLIRLTQAGLVVKRGKTYRSLAGLGSAGSAPTMA